MNTSLINTSLKTAIDESEAVIIGVGNEFILDKLEVIKENSTYILIKDILDKLIKTEKIDSIIVQYVINSIYYFELQNRENKLIRNIIDLYNRLYNKIKDRNYFMITTCNDSIINYSDFEKEKIASPCGDISRLQYACMCEEGENINGILDGSKCLAKIYEILSFMGKEFSVNAISNLIPKCSQCGANLSFNIHGEGIYNENGYALQWENYTKFLQRTLNKRLVLLELGVDFSTPTVIRWPFEKIAMLNNKATLYRINEKFPQLTEEIKDKGISIKQCSLTYIKENL